MLKHLELGLDEIGRFAIDVVRAAGAEISRQRQDTSIEVSAKHATELVTSADLASDRIIRNAITGAYPDHRLLSEEGDSGMRDWSGPVWIADPIDGTVNYVQGSRQVAISLALAQDGVVDLGVVRAPFRDETYFAKRGAGAWLLKSGRPAQKLSVNRKADLQRALIGTGFPHDRSDLGLLLRRLEAVLKACQDVRRLGSPCLDVCRVASGLLDAYYETIFPWDIAAAGLIAREAGAVTGHISAVPEGEPIDLWAEGVVMAPPELMPPLLSVLRSVA